MSPTLPVEAFLIAARKHRLLDRGEAAALQEPLTAAQPATPPDIDGWLERNGGQFGDRLVRLRRLLPDAAMWDDYKPHRPLAHLAAGGMGDIWLARDAQSGDLVVIKTMRGDFAVPAGTVEVEDDGTVWLDTGSGGGGGEASPGSAMQRRIERESRITRQLQHPNIVRCRDHGLTRSGHLFMVLDYHGSGDLFELISLHGHLPEALALSLIEQVAGGLEASHRLNLVHRDIKAGNIFLTADGGAKLADFGFARSTRANRTQLTVAGSIIGSPSCMSPEQIDGRSELDIRTDLYALGCVLFHALTGTPPFTGTVQDMMRGHCSVPPPAIATLRTGISTATIAIVERCLRKERDARYATPAELRREVQAALTALGVAPGTRVPLPARPANASARLPTSAMVTIDLPPPTTPATSVTTAAAQQVVASGLSPVTPLMPIAAPSAPTAAGASTRTAVATPPPASGKPLGDWLVLRDHDTVVALYARTRLTLGKLMDASVDVCLRNYPEERYRSDCMRISRQHVAITVDAAGHFQIQDLGSANGTAIDGEALVAGRPVAITPGIDHQVEVAQVISLRARAVPDRTAARGCAALVLARPRNRPGLAYALVRSEVSLGGPGADLILPGCDQGVGAVIGWNGGRWSWRSTADQPWIPLGDGATVSAGARRWTAHAGDPEATL